MSQVADALVRFDNVRTQFGDEIVLDGVSFAVDEGEFVCLLGPSGCGKSTTLRILGNLLTDYSGDVQLDGQSPAVAWPRLGYVFQSPRLVPWRTALGNVLLSMELRQQNAMKTAERQRRAREALELVGLERDANKYPAVLSGGERQRVSIARTLAIDPDVILMDEPLSALDVRTRQYLRNEILRIWRETRKTILFVTHDLDEALFLADRIVVFSNKPTRVLRTYTIDQPRPRSIANDAALLDIRADLASLFEGSSDVEELLGADAGA